MNFIRNKFKIVCLICFLLTSGAGVFAILFPGVIHFLAGKPFNPESGLFFYRFGFLLVAIVGLWFLIIMTNPDGNRLLLSLATLEKFALVVFIFWAIANRAVSPLFVIVALGDLLMGIACLFYLIVGKPKEIETTTA